MDAHHRGPRVLARIGIVAAVAVLALLGLGTLPAGPVAAGPLSCPDGTACATVAPAAALGSVDPTGSSTDPVTARTGPHPGVVVAVALLVVAVGSVLVGERRRPRRRSTDPRPRHRIASLLDRTP